MPTSIWPQDQEGQELYHAISSFFSKFHIGDLLRKYKLCNVFADRSMYMQQKTGSYREAFSKNTFYRFMNGTRTN